VTSTPRFSQVAIGLLALGCRPATPARSPGGAAPSDCASEVRAFLGKRFAELHGLPPACRLDDVATALGGPAASDTGWLGEQPRRASFRMAVVAGYADPIRIWHDQGGLVMLDAEYPAAPGGWPALRAALGAPDAKLDYRWGVVTVAGGEWVYLSRGLSVFLTPALDTVVRVAAFAPTSLAAYRQTLRPVSRIEELPVPASSSAPPATEPSPAPAPAPAPSILTLPGGGKVAFSPPSDGRAPGAEGPPWAHPVSLRGRQLPSFVRVVGTAVRISPTAAFADVVLSFPAARAPAGMVPVVARARGRTLAIDEDWGPIGIAATPGEVGAWSLSPAELDAANGVLTARLAGPSDLAVVLGWVPGEVMEPAVSRFIAPPRPIYVADHDLELDDAPTEARLVLGGGARAEYSSGPRWMELGINMWWRTLRPGKGPPAPLRRPVGPSLALASLGGLNSPSVAVSIPARRPAGSRAWRPVLAVEQSSGWTVIEAEFDERSQRMEAVLPSASAGRLRFGWERAPP
jgi:hypothetical protein